MALIIRAGASGYVDDKQIFGRNGVLICTPDLIVAIKAAMMFCESEMLSY